MNHWVFMIGMLLLFGALMTTAIGGSYQKDPRGPWGTAFWALFIGGVVSVSGSLILIR